MFEIDLQGLFNIVKDAGAKPETLQAIGAFVLFVIGYHTTRLTWQAVRGPVSLGWAATKFLTGSAFGLSKLGIVPLAWLMKTRTDSPLVAACKAALMSDRLTWEPAAEQGSPERLRIVSASEPAPFVANFCADGPLCDIDINGEEAPFASKRDKKIVAKLARKRADQLKAEHAELTRSLLTEHLTRAVAPQRPDLRGGTNRVSTHKELLNAVASGKYPYG